jgi:hypothetical protein
VFVPDEPFQPSLIFASKAGTYLSEVIYGLTRKRLTRLERLARDKHSSFLKTLVNYGRKKFYNIGLECKDEAQARRYFSGVSMVSSI